MVSKAAKAIHYAKSRVRPVKRPEPWESCLWVALWAGLAVVLAVHAGAGSGLSVQRVSASCGVAVC